MNFLRRMKVRSNGLSKRSHSMVVSPRRRSQLCMLITVIALSSFLVLHVSGVLLRLRQRSADDDGFMSSLAKSGLGSGGLGSLLGGGIGGGIEGAVTGAAIRSLVPEPLAPYADSIVKRIQSSNSPECKNIVTQCLSNKGPVTCRELLMDCLMGSSLGDNPEAHTSSLGDVDLLTVMGRLAVAARFQSVAQVISRVAQGCQAYFPESVSALLHYFNPLKKGATPQHQYVCSALTGRPVSPVVAMSTYGFSGTCTYDDAMLRCVDTVERSAAQMERYFGVYLAMIENDPNAMAYNPGSSLDSGLQKASAIPQSSVHGANYPTTPAACMKDPERRVQCTAAALLAEACEISCAIAKCSWKTLYQRGGCSSTDKTTVFQSSTTLCQDMAQKLKLTNTLPVCSGVMTAQSSTSVIIAASLIVFFLVADASS